MMGQFIYQNLDYRGLQGSLSKFTKYYKWDSSRSIRQIAPKLLEGQYREKMSQRFESWQDLTRLDNAA